MKIKQVYERIRTSDLLYPVIHHKPWEVDRKQQWLRELQDSKFALSTNISVIHESTAYLVATWKHVTIYIAISPNLMSYIGFVYRMFVRILRRVACLCECFQIDEPMQIWVIPDMTPRTMPSEGTPIAPHNINGGFTYRTTNGIQIVITRWEEFPKVIVHEVLHHARLDKTWTHEDLMRLHQLWNISKEVDIRPNEAIVEFWAELCQMIFVSVDTGVPVTTLYQEELEYVLDASKRLLEHQTSLVKERWMETTHAYSYILLRGLFWVYWHEFMHMKDSDRLTDWIQKKWKMYRAQVERFTIQGRKRRGLRMTRAIADF